MIYFAKEGTQEGLGDKLVLNPKMANRHGFICGATGTGKTVTLKVLAESFSSIGVPVFVSDVKGDVSGLCKAGADSESMQNRIERFGLNEFRYRGFPCSFFDIYGEKGVPLRTTVSEIGPILMARILDLNDTQTDLLTVVYKIADDHSLLLIDTKDLKAVLNFAYENRKELEMDYGQIARVSVSAIIRSIVALEAEGGDSFFGEPAIDIKDFFVTTADGYGMINILDSEALINKPKLYSAFMLFFLSELFEVLPEVGDPEKPKMVFFFDEAHLIFNNATQTLLDKITQVVKLIRSKGVGIYFITQSPSDIPEPVLSQLSNKIEHALRAYTPAELKALKATAEAFRENPEFDTYVLLQQLGTGEAIVSMLDEKGIPSIARHAFILPPESSMEAITGSERENIVNSSIYRVKYGTPVDSESAYEFLVRLKKQKDAEKEEAEQTLLEQIRQEKEEKEAQKQKEKEEKAAKKEAEKKEKAVKQAAKNVTSSVTGTIGRELGKSVGKTIGGSFGKTLGGNIGASLGRNIFGTLFKL